MSQSQAKLPLLTPAISMRIVAATGTMVNIEFINPVLILRDGKHLLEPDGSSGSLTLQYAGIKITRIN